MNYISHFYSLENKSAYSSLGVLLPDIFPRFSYFHNKFFLRFDVSKLSIEEEEIWRGITVHYSDDIFFHESTFFKHGMQRIEEEMKKDPCLSNLKRKYLISHVLYELILDHLIIQRFPNIVYEIYNHLEFADIGVLNSFLTKIIGEINDIQVLLESFNRFLNRRFLNFYKVDCNLVKSLHMVSGKISQWEYNDLMVDKFTEIIRKMKNEIDFDEVFDSILKHKEIA